MASFCSTPLSWPDALGLPLPPSRRARLLLGRGARLWGTDVCTIQACVSWPAIAARARTTHPCRGRVGARDAVQRVPELWHPRLCQECALPAFASRRGGATAHLYTLQHAAPANVRRAPQARRPALWFIPGSSDQAARLTHGRVLGGCLNRTKQPAEWLQCQLCSKCMH